MSASADGCGQHLSVGSSQLSFTGYLPELPDGTIIIIVNADLNNLEAKRLLTVTKLVSIESKFKCRHLDYRVHAPNRVSYAVDSWTGQVQTVQVHIYTDF